MTNTPSATPHAAQPDCPTRSRNKVRKAVLPAAGLGTRFLPATKAQPKEMLIVVDKPQIQYVAEECVASGIDHIIIVTGKGKNSIEDHFDSAPALERFLEERGRKDQAEMVRKISNMVQVSYTRQKVPLGLGHAVLVARDLVGPEPFYVLPSAIFDCLERTKPGAGNEIQLTDALRILAREQGLWAYIYDGVSYDAGDKLGFLKATVEIALQNPEFGAAFRSYLKTLKL